MEHKTPLSHHFKGLHIWLDMALLCALFIVAAYFPLFKIVPLVASLELFSFFSLHLLPKQSRLPLQGFLGGFISSTAVYVQTLNDEKFSGVDTKNLLYTLFFALNAMLLECLFILYFLATDLAFKFYVPFLAQLSFFVLVLFWLRAFWAVSDDSTGESSASAQDLSSELIIDHPIIWKNVARLSTFIVGLMLLMRFLADDLGLSRDVSTLLVSFFEAHAILASVITEWSLSSQSIDLMKLIFLILLGNALSKSFLILKGRNLAQKKMAISLVLAGLVASLLATYGWLAILDL